MLYATASSPTSAGSSAKQSRGVEEKRTLNRRHARRHHPASTDHNGSASARSESPPLHSSTFRLRESFASQPTRVCTRDSQPSRARSLGGWRMVAACVLYSLAKEHACKRIHQRVRLYVFSAFVCAENPKVRCARALARNHAYTLCFCCCCS